MIRLQRFLADAGIASRRDCEKMIADGRIRVNDQTVTALPVFVDPRQDRVAADGRLIDPRAARSGRVYLILNKPDNTLTSTRDESGQGRDSRRTVIDMVDHPAKSRLFPVGRLDFHATGMVLLTNDGQLAQRLTHARYGVTKTYRITVRGRLHGEAVEALTRRFCPSPEAMADLFPASHGDDGDFEHPPQPLTFVSYNESGTTFDIVMRAGAGAGSARNPFAPAPRRSPIAAPRARDGADGDRTSLAGTKALIDMLDKMGNPVKRIHRTAIGPLTMRYVTVGTARALRDEEVELLLVAAGLRKPRPRSHSRGTSRAKPDRPTSRTRPQPGKPQRPGRPTKPARPNKPGKPASLRNKPRSADAPSASARTSRSKSFGQRPNNSSRQTRRK